VIRQDLSGEEHPFPLDLVPRIIDSEEWTVVESGVRQRVLALEQLTHHRSCVSATRCRPRPVVGVGG
jgi:uncharacterized circularly permuted ATP-grasp superfamily protein